MTAERVHRRGILLAASGSLLWSPDGLLIRLLSADAWQIIAWRSLAFALAIAAVMAFRHREGFIAVVRRSTPMALWSGLIMGAANICFILSITQTTVANTLFLLATMPVFAAILSRAVLGDRVAGRTWALIAAALAGIALILAEQLGGGGLWGNLFGLFTAILLAANLLIIRRNPAMSLLPAFLVSGLVSGTTGFLLADVAAVSTHDLAIILAQGALQSTVALLLFLSAARDLPPAEVALFALVETVLGPVWVWLALGERPGVLALIGGAVVLTALALHSVLALNAARRAPLVARAPAS